jgi:hypothetical protein
MSGKDDRLQQIWHRYETDRQHKPTSAREAVEWAVEEGLLELPETDPYDILAGWMAQALRNEYQTDEKGRRYRVNHSVRVTKGGVQYSFWGSMPHSSHDFMEKTFAQRRELIIGECAQLKVDVDVYNEMIDGQKPTIQLVLDFTEDVAEREQVNKAA